MLGLKMGGCQAVKWRAAPWGEVVYYLSGTSRRVTQVDGRLPSGYFRSPRNNNLSYPRNSFENSRMHLLHLNIYITAESRELFALNLTTFCWNLNIFAFYRLIKNCITYLEKRFLFVLFFFTTLLEKIE